MRDVISAAGMFWRAAGSRLAGVALYNPAPGETGGREGEHAEEPLGDRSKGGADPGPPSRRSRLPKADPARSRSSPGWQDHAAVAATSPPPPSASTSAPGGEAQEEGERGEGAPGPGAPRRRLTQRRGARLRPREHAPAAGDSSSVRGKASAPPPGFRARS